MDSQINEKIKINQKITGRLFFKCNLKNITALALSNGEDEYSDADILRDSQGKPVIPATAFIGALKAFAEANYSSLYNESTFAYLFGYAGNKGKYGIQAHLIIDDLICISEYKTNIRDGVKINSKTNLAIDQGKYDFEILEQGSFFSLKGEITYRQGFDSDKVDVILQFIQYVLKSGKFQVGGFTSNGFGQLKLEGDISSTGILQNQEYIRFISNPDSFEFNHKIENKKFQSETNESVFIFKLKPTTPLFIGGGEIYAKNADDASLKSIGKYVLSAKSLKGALRHHAFRIANTVHGESIAHRICNDIFGNRPKEEKEKIKLTKSRFWTSDGIIINEGDIKSQSQVSIDRFTGGAMESALFSTEPVWPTDSTYVDIEWRISKNPEHIGLLLLVARDLITEMLPVGGDKAIGRGRFKAEKSTLDHIDIRPDRTWNNVELSEINNYITAFLDLKTYSHGIE